MTHVDTLQSTCQVPPLQLAQGPCKAMKFQLISCTSAERLLRDPQGSLLPPTGTCTSAAPLVHLALISSSSHHRHVCWRLPRPTHSAWRSCWRLTHGRATASACTGTWERGRAFLGDSQTSTCLAVTLVLQLSSVASSVCFWPCTAETCRCLCCSREFIRSAYDEPDLPVPSPTYLLQNIYDDLEGTRLTGRPCSLLMCAL
jgi:hypothetical protein